MQTATFPAARTKTVDADVQAVLSECRVDDNVVYLPARQLERALYGRVDKVLTALGGRWDRKARGHVFTADPRQVIEHAAGAGEYNNIKQDLQFFETPLEIGARMTAALELAPGDKILEPEAGRGRLILPLPIGVYDICAVEIDAINADFLRRATADRTDVQVLQGDFLALGDGLRRIGPFDIALMNPPFARNQDITHIAAAWSLLRPGGRLAAICSEHPFFAQDAKSMAFREWIAEIAADCDKLPANSFAASGTSVSTRLIVARKPG